MHVHNYAYYTPETFKLDDWALASRQRERHANIFMYPISEVNIEPSFEAHSTGVRFLSFLETIHPLYGTSFHAV